MARSWIALGAVVLMLSTGPLASAGPSPVQLTYHAAPEIPDCPDLDQLKGAVERRLGAAPWDLRATRRVSVEVSQHGGELQAFIETTNHGTPTGKRILTSRVDCRELAEAMALAISIAIDPLSVPRPASNPTATTQPSTRPVADAAEERPAEAPTATATKAAAPSTERSAGVGLTLGVGGSLVLGSAPGAAGGAMAHVGVRWRALSVALEGRFDFPAFEEVRGGRISTWLAGGSVAGCWHRWWLMGCGVVTAAALTARGHELVGATEVTRAYAGAGIRAGIDIPLVSKLAVRGRAEVLFPFTRVHLVDTLTADRYWSTPPVSGGLGFDLIWHLL